MILQVDEGNATLMGSLIKITVEDQNYISIYHRIREFEVKETLKRMDSGKVTGLDNIPIEVWKCQGEKGINKLTKLFNRIIRSKKRERTELY